MRTGSHKRRLFTSFFAAGVAVLAISTGAASCQGSSPSGLTKEHKAQAQDTKNLENNQPIPVYEFSQIRATLIDVSDLQAEGKSTTAFFFINGVPNPVFVCPAVGQPIPVTAQLSNPEQELRQYSENYNLPQMDPNGIYTPPDAEGTNVVCIDPATGTKFVHYSEGPVDDVAGPAKWDATKHQIVLTGNPVSVQHTK